MDLVKLDIKDVITDIICIRDTISLLPLESRENICEFVLEQISRVEGTITEEQLIVLQTIFFKVKNSNYNEKINERIERINVGGY